MNIKLLIQSINTINIYQREKLFDFSSISIQKKTQNAINQLEIKANELHQPVALLIHMYAYFYMHVYKAKSSNMILLKVTEFLQKTDFDKFPQFLDDIDLAYIVGKDWNSMHQITANEFPFQVRKFLSKSRVKIYIDTFFKHSSEFHYFCMIAHFINTYRLDFPQIHSIKEFFLHLPIITRRPRTYFISNYLNCYSTLDKYYTMVYGKDKTEKVTERLPNFLTTLTLDSFPYLESSKIWCKQEAINYLANEKRL